MWSSVLLILVVLVAAGLLGERSPPAEDLSLTCALAAAPWYSHLVELSSLLMVKTLTGMTTGVYPRENCIAQLAVAVGGTAWFGGVILHGNVERNIDRKRRLSSWFGGG